MRSAAKNHAEANYYHYITAISAQEHVEAFLKFLCDSSQVERFDIGVCAACDFYETVHVALSHHNLGGSRARVAVRLYLYYETSIRCRHCRPDRPRYYCVKSSSMKAALWRTQHEW